jgi:hypothetical protein
MHNLWTFILLATYHSQLEISTLVFIGLFFITILLLWLKHLIQNYNNNIYLYYCIMYLKPYELIYTKMIMKVNICNNSMKF